MGVAPTTLSTNLVPDPEHTLLSSIPHTDQACGESGSGNNTQKLCGRDPFERFSGNLSFKIEETERVSKTKTTQENDQGWSL